MTIRSYQYLVQALVTPPSGGEVVRSITQGLSVTDGVTYELNTVNQVVEQDTELEEFASWLLLPGDQDNFVQELGLSDIALSSFHPNVVQGLSVNDSAVGVIAELVQATDNSLNMMQAVVVGYKARALIVEDTLGFGGVASRSFSGVTAQDLGFEDRGSFTDTFQNLGLTDESDWGYGYDGSNTLIITQELDVNQVLNKTLEQDTLLVTSVAWFIESRCARNQFSQFEGSSVGARTPRLEYANTFLIQSKDTGEIVQLRNPETDNRRRYAFNRVSRSFFDGTADVYVDDNWAIEESQIYTIVALKRDQLDALQQFLLDNLGREVLIKDWKGVTWSSIVVNPGEVYTEDAEDYWTIEFEVQGDELPGEYVLDVLGLSDEISRAGSIWTRDTTSGGFSDQLNRDFDEDPSSTFNPDSLAIYTIV